MTSRSIDRSLEATKQKFFQNKTVKNQIILASHRHGRELASWFFCGRNPLEFRTTHEHGTWLFLPTNTFSRFWRCIGRLNSFWQRATNAAKTAAPRRSSLNWHSRAQRALNRRSGPNVPLGDIPIKLNSPSITLFRGHWSICNVTTSNSVGPRSIWK